MTRNTATQAATNRSGQATRWFMAALVIVTLALFSAANAQHVDGTQIVLPDGSVCAPIHEAYNKTVAGARLEYTCREGGELGLVGGIIESSGQVSLEVVDPYLPAGTLESRLAVFRVNQLVLANGAVCVPASDIVVADTDVAVNYSCTSTGGSTTVVLGEFESGKTNGHFTSFATVAQLDLEGAVVSTERLAISVIDGTLPFTQVRWVLSSWGTGEAPPLADAVPTLEFHEGRIAGTGGCNNYFAGATILSEGQIELGPVGSTLMACPDERMQQEFRFFAALDGVTGYEYFGGKLYLYGGAEVISFEPVAEQ